MILTLTEKKYFLCVMNHSAHPVQSVRPLMMYLMSHVINNKRRRTAIANSTPSVHAHWAVSQKNLASCRATSRAVRPLATDLSWNVVLVDACKCTGNGERRVRVLSRSKARTQSTCVSGRERSRYGRLRCVRAPPSERELHRRLWSGCHSVGTWQSRPACHACSRAPARG